MTSWPTWVKVCAISAGVTVVAAFLPWASLFGVSISGLKGDGQVTAIVAVVGAIALLGRRRRRLILLVESAAAAVVTLVGLVDMNGVSAIGLYLTLFGGLAWIVGVVLGWRTADALTAVPASPPPLASPPVIPVPTPPAD